MDVYVYEGEIYCEDCADSSCDESCHDGGGEADFPVHCGECGDFLENPLTDYGMAYVARAIRSQDGDPGVLATWSDFYGISAD